MPTPSVVARVIGRALTWLRRALTTLTVVAATATVLGLAVLHHAGKQLLIVTSGSMVPTFNPGDVVIVQQRRISDLKTGMIITFRAPVGEGQLTTHRIHDVVHRPEGVFFQTKGDANPAPDPNLAPAGNVRGVLTSTVPWVGRWLVFYQSPRGRVVILGWPLLMMALSQCMALWRSARRLRVARHHGSGERAEASPVAQATARHTPWETRTQRRVAARAVARTRRRLIGASVAATVAIASGLGVMISHHTNALFTSAATVSANTFRTASSFCGVASPWAAVICQDAPTTWLRMDEQTSDPVVHDSGSAAQNGMRVGSVTPGGESPVAGDSGDHAYAFSGGLVGVQPGVGLPAAFTVELLFRTPAGEKNKVTGGPLVSLGHFGSDWTGHVDAAVYLTKDGTLAFGTDVGNGNGKKTTGQTAARVDDGGWHHVVATRNAAGQLSLYLDGAPVFQGLAGDAGSAPGTVGLVAGHADLNSWLNAPIPDAFTGDMDEVAFYDSALSQAQVAAHFQALGLTR